MGVGELVDRRRNRGRRACTWYRGGCTCTGHRRRRAGNRGRRASASGRSRARRASGRSWARRASASGRSRARPASPYSGPHQRSTGLRFGSGFRFLVSGRFGLLASNLLGFLDPAYGSFFFLFAPAPDKKDGAQPQSGETGRTTTFHNERTRDRH